MNRYQEICRQFYDNRLLFGDPAEAGIVAVEIAAPDEVEIFRRAGAALTRERRPLKLFVLLAEPGMLNGLGAPYEIEPLEGNFRLAMAVRPSTGSTRWKPRGAICASSPANRRASPTLPTWCSPTRSSST